MKENIHYVNNSSSDIREFMPYFKAAYESGQLCEDLADLFEIQILKGYNPDGSDRLIINAA